MKNKWATEIERIKQATKLNIELLSCISQDLEETRQLLEAEGREIIRTLSQDGTRWFIVIEKKDWTETSRILLSLLLQFEDDDEAVEDSEYKAAEQWLKQIYTGAAAPFPDRLSSAWKWTEGRVCFVIERINARSQDDLSAWLELLNTFFRGKQKLTFYPLSNQVSLLLVPLSILPESEGIVDAPPEYWLEWAASLHDLLSTEALEAVRIVVSKPISHPELLVQNIQRAKQTLVALQTIVQRTLVAGDWQYPVEKWITSLDSAVLQSLHKALRSQWDLPFISDEQKETFEALSQNNLSISETARSLYLHRNTLLYRLDRLKEQTGLDPRQFGDATLLRFALLLDKMSK